MSGRYIDLTGQRFGRLIVLQRVENRIVSTRSQKSQWLCRCDCGNEVIAVGSNLRRGKKLSCGCLQREATSQSNSTHKCTGTRLHNEWRAMKARCYIPSCSNFEYYGGRGIQVCDEWKDDFAAFKKWALSNGYTDKLSIDRINPDGDYEPSNCRWVTMKKQFWNRTLRKTNKTGVSGVSWREDIKKWRAQITVDRKRINLGNFENKDDAVKARKEAEKKYWV